MVKNRAKVGSARPSSLLYTYGPGAIMDLPGFSVMPAGLDDWEPIWKRRELIPTHHRAAPAQRRTPAPRPPGRRAASVPVAAQARAHVAKEGTDLGIPARVFPQWFRCTGCDYLGPLPRFTLHQHPPVPPRPRAVHPQELPGSRRPAHGLDSRQAREPRRARPAPADLHQRSPRRVPLRAVGAPRRPSARRPSCPTSRCVTPTSARASARRSSARPAARPAAWPRRKARSAATSCRRSAADVIRTSTPSTPNATPAQR